MEWDEEELWDDTIVRNILSQELEEGTIEHCESMNTSNSENVEHAINDARTPNVDNVEANTENAETPNSDNVDTKIEDLKIPNTENVDDNTVNTETQNTDNEDNNTVNTETQNTDNMDDNTVNTETQNTDNMDDNTVNTETQNTDNVDDNTVNTETQNTDNVDDNTGNTETQNTDNVDENTVNTETQTTDNVDDNTVNTEIQNTDNVDDNTVNTETQNTDKVDANMDNAETTNTNNVDANMDGASVTNIDNADKAKTTHSDNVDANMVTAETQNTDNEDANMDNAEIPNTDNLDANMDNEKTPNNANVDAGMGDNKAPNSDQVDASMSYSNKLKCDNVDTNIENKKSFNCYSTHTTDNKRKTLSCNNTKTSKTKKKSGSVALLGAQNVVNKYRRGKKPVPSAKKKEKKKANTKQEGSDSEYSSSDNIPLQYLKDNGNITTRRKKTKTYTQLFTGDFDDEVIYDSEDSYKPSKKDRNSSDSEFSPDESSGENDYLIHYAVDSKRHKHQRKEKNHESLDKADDQPSNNIIENAKERSLQESQLNDLISNHHATRLDGLLDANGMLRKSIKADGNCFFRAALFHLPAIKKAKELRHLLCDHMIDNAEEYTGFFPSSGPLDSAEQDLRWIDFSVEVDQLRGDGIWSNKAADMLPLALANYTGRRVRIFSSTSEASILDIEPTIQQIQDTERIYLAYVGSRGISEHYDGCVKKQQNIPNVQVLAKDAFSCELNSITIAENNRESPNNRPEQSSESIGKHQEKSPLKVNAQKRGRPKGTPKKKSASFMTPPKKKLSRKRKATPETWKKNIRKKLKLTGQQYVTQRGKTVNARVIKSVNCNKCKLKCSTKFSEEKRTEIFQSFWSLGSYERQKDFVVSHVEEKKTRTYLADDNQPVKKRRQVYRSFSFEVNESRVTVCKKFFLSTLSIGESYVDHAMKNKSGGIFAGSDKRGRHRPYNKTTERAAQLVREHIESFPALEGHYTRKDSNRKYLGHDLNITKMYELYIELHKGKLREGELVSQPIYRRIFNEEYNFSFHTPKKDQCSLCVNYHKAVNNNTASEKEKAEFEKHQERKKRAREEKQKDKMTAKSTNDTFAATFDLQAVLYTPCSLVSQLYYTRKLSCYNLSIYNLSSSNATCYLWSEVEAKRGSCEIGTCLYLQLLSLPSNIKHVIFYSDACSGQNRNQFTATSLMHAATYLPNIDTIDHKFLESGHTQMECDSMHAAIEFAKKKTEIYIPQQWSTVIRMARRKDPYNVVPLTHEDIWDFKKVQSQAMKYSKVEFNGTKINWLNIKWLRFLKEEPDNILFKYNFEEGFRKMKITGSGKRGRPEKTKDLPRKYNGKQAISQAKKKDLLNLCRTKVISSEYHDFYKNLQSSNNVADRLPEPDVDEADTDSETE